MFMKYKYDSFTYSAVQIRTSQDSLDQWFRNLERIKNVQIFADFFSDEVKLQEELIFH